MPPTPASDAASAHYAPYGRQGGQYGEFTPYADPATAAFGTDSQMATGFATDPYFGGFPGDGSTGSYDTAQWSTGSHATLGTGSHQTLGVGMHQMPVQDPYATQHHAAFDTGAYDTAAWAVGYQQLAGIPAQATAPDATGQWDAHAWLEAGQSADRTQQWDWGTQTFDTGTYDATQWNSGGTVGHATHDPQTTAATATATFEQVTPESFDQQATAAFAPVEPFARQAADFEQLPYEEPAADDRSDHLPEDSGDVPLLEDEEEFTPSPRAANRSRRRAPAKRSALLKVAVPSVCVLGVAGIAAATVGMGEKDDKDTAAEAPTAAPVKPSTANKKLDSQLANLSAGADDFMDRASRTQQRIDLKAQQAAEQRKAAAEAALRERLRPKFAVPVARHGLSAYYGQSGVNWMSVHTGIDFPVTYATVMAATDGTVRTQFNSAYGNMIILTAKDGTETWYCHLSSYQVPSGTVVKAGDPIARSGDSGNSTGPHLHFEVRPGGGAAIDPLAWFRSHGLDPT
jgi:murein DD-endopeptidase MepM/ murein hydrolase activator NlpD